MVKKLIIIGDADSIIAQINPNDSLYKKALKVSKKLLRLWQQNFNLLVS